jgi:hypothetical protein
MPPVTRPAVVHDTNDNHATIAMIRMPMTVHVVSCGSIELALRSVNQGALDRWVWTIRQHEYDPDRK